MKNAGSAFLILGIGSIVLYFIGYEFRILSWIDNWGEGVGWTIRGAMLIVGGVLFFLGMKSEGGESEAESEPHVESAPAPSVAPAPAPQGSPGPAPGSHTEPGAQTTGGPRFD